MRTLDTDKDLEISYNIGWVLVFTVLFNTLVNLGFVMVENCITVEIIGR